MMNDTYGINIPYYITPSGFNSAYFSSQGVALGYLITALLGL